MGTPAENLQNMAVPMDTSKLSMNDRFTMRLEATYQGADDFPVQQQCFYSSMLKSSGEQCYARKVKVGAKWTPLDLGWIKPDDASLIMLFNKTGSSQHVNPTKEEVEALAKSILEVAVGKSVEDLVPQWKIPPGRFFCAEPLQASNIFVRGGNSPISLSICVIPS